MLMLKKDEMGFESMIRLCVCTKKSSSPFENLKHREGSKSCKSCGGKLPVNGRGSQRGSMLSTVGLELSKVIDPQLTWKTASNGRQRAVRRARTSFIGANGNNSPANSSKSSKDLKGKDSRSTRDMPVSESEKLGVSILGRRFSDNLGSVPIKKRRLLLVHSPSPPHHSSYSKDSGHVSERQREDTMVIGKERSLDTNSSSGSEFGQGGNFAIDKTDQEGVSEKISDAADFSGISILAAAACDSNIGGEFLTVDDSLSKLHASEIQETQESAKVDFSPGENFELLPHSSEDLAGRTDLPFETSSSSVLPSKESNEKSDGSCNVEKSVNSLPCVPTESSSRDVRFHWDLNTVMDAWEGHEEGLNSKQGAAINVSEDGHHDVEPFTDQVGFGDTKDVPTSSDIVDGRVNLGGGEEQVICAAEVKIEVASGSVDGKETNPCFAQVYITAEECQPNDINQNSSVSGDLPSPNRGAKISVRTLRDSSSSSTFGLEEEKAEGHHQNFHLKVQTGRSSVVSSDVVILDPSKDIRPQLQVDKVLMEARADVSTEGTTLTRSSEIEKCESFHETSSIAPETMKNGRNLVDCYSAETGCEVLVDENISENKVTGSVENLCTNMLDETDHDDAGKPKEKDMCEGASVAMEMKVDDTKCCASTDDTDAAKKDSSINFSHEVTPDSTGMTPIKTDSPPPILGCEVAHTDVCANDPGQVTSEDHLEYEHYSDVSKDDTNQTAGMEKLDFLGDDDSQYEDGEFREPLGNCWLDDGAEEGETECVDYGSDRDIDIYEAASEFTSFNRNANSAGLPEASHDVQCQEVGKHRLDGSSRFFESCPADVLDVASGKKAVENVKGLLGNPSVITGSKHLLTDLKGTSEFCADTGNGIWYNGFLKEAAGTKGSINSSDSRMKMSGWDKLPVGCRNSGNGAVDTRIGSGGRNHNGAFADLSRDGCPIRRELGSSYRRDFSSQTERMQPSDLPRRHDKPYARASRSNDRNDFNPRGERDAHNHRSIGRSAPPLHLQGRGRGEHWVDSTNHGHNKHESSSYYGSASCSHNSSRDAAAAAVAKVESNGFVVAPDGTIVKAGGLGPSGHLTRRSANASSHSSHRSPPGRESPIGRERSFGMRSGPGRSRDMMSPDRPIFTGRGKPGRYGPGTAGINHRERHPGPVSDDNLDSPSSVHHPMSRRDGSFSPLPRRLLHLSRSRSRSPSRSRTRSPHRWISPRGRYDNGSYGGGPGFRRRSRSPNFKPEARMHRSRAGFVERIPNYASFSRNHASPPHSSRWADGRKELPEHLSEYEYRRCSGRSPPPRVFSRGQRFDSIDSTGRPKTDEYYRQPNSGRHPEFVGFDRGDRHDRGGERRDHDNRYGMLHSGRQYVNNDNMKRLRYDAENGFRPKNVGPKSLQFQRREGPGDFDRGTERQLGDSPGQSEVAKGRFRSDGDGNHSAKFKSFGVHEGDDNTDAQRRPL